MRVGNRDEDQRNPAKVELEKKKIIFLILGGWVSFENYLLFFGRLFGPLE